ncbi:15591_t:CDS:2, partial [Funneliformis caledonium]
FRENLSCIDIMISFNNETLKPLGQFLIFPEIIEEGLPNVNYRYMENKLYSVVPSVFSSWDLSVELDIKGNIFSSPYIDGIAALYIEVFGKSQSYEQLKVAFMNNAIPYKDHNNLLALVVIQDAGFVDAFKLLKATSLVYSPKINLNDTVHFNEHYTLKIYNVGRKEMKYKLSHSPAPKQCAGVEFDYNQIAVPPKLNVEVSVTFILPNKIPKDLHLFYS